MQTALFIIVLFIRGALCQVCDLHNSVELTERSYNGVKYDEGEYIVDNSTGVATERGCVCMKETCARKCCPFGQIYDEDTFACINNSKPFEPLEGSNEGEVKNAFHMFTALMKCDKAKNEVAIFLGDLAEDFYLSTDGFLYYTVITNGTQSPAHSLGPDKYCIDNFLALDNSSLKLNALACFTPDREENGHFQLSAVCMLISCFFILLTVSVYAFLPELRNTVPGIIMMAYLSSLFVGFVFMATMQLMLLYGYLSHKNCTWMAIVIYFFILAAFFWLNVMCYDLWWKFKRINTTTHGFTIEDRRRVLWYTLYACGVPTVLTVLMIALEFSDISKYNIFLPHLRRQGCFFQGVSKLIWLYTPMLILCVANLVLFILVARRIAYIKKQIARLQKKDTQRFAVYLKLFIVTGVNWVLEAVSALFPDISYVWQFSDAYNVLVGVIIFFIFVCKKKMWEDILKRIQVLRGKAPPAVPSPPATTTSTQSNNSIPMQPKSQPKQISSSVETVVDSLNDKQSTEQIDKGIA